MKVYKVKVNGKVYEVELEAVSEQAGSVAPSAKAEEKPAAAPVTGGQGIKAPIAGKVVALKVKVGDVIKVGDIVGVIEAMKLENEVPSPVAGKVAAINAKVGSVVANGEVIITLE